MKQYAAPLFLFLLGLCTGQAAVGQNIGILQVDSLRRELTGAKQDTSRALIMADLAEAYRGEKSDSTFYFGQEALQLARTRDFPLGEMRALMILSYYFMNTGNLTQALDAGLKALSLAKKHQFIDYEGACLIRVGNVYRVLNQYTEALNYYREANWVLSNGSHPFFYGVTYWVMAISYLGMGKIDSCLYMSKIAYDKGKELNNPIILSGVMSVQARAYVLRGERELAKQYFHSSMAISASSREFVAVADRSLDLADLFRELGPVDSAVYYANSAFELVKSRSLSETKMRSAHLLSTLYEEDDPRESLRYLRIANGIRDSIYQTEKLQSAQALAFVKKERDNEVKLEELSYRNRVRQYALLAGIGLMLLIALLLYRNNRSKQKTNLALQQQRDQIEKTLTELRTTQSQLIQKEKMASLGEMTAGIAHEIQNPLNFVNNFAEVNRELIAEINEAAVAGNLEDIKSLARDIADNEEKIRFHGQRADGIVKAMLQHSRSGSGQKEPTDINALCDEYLRLAYHGLRAKDKSFNAKFETDLDPAVGKIPVLPQDMGRVILNLINNAFYAVSAKALATAGGGYEPTVRVTTRKVEDNVEIKIIDNGTGIPQKVIDKIFQPFFTTKPTGEGTGLGLSLSYDIVTKGHGGELKVETTEGQGTTFTIIL